MNFPSPLKFQHFCWPWFALVDRIIPIRCFLSLCSQLLASLLNYTSLFGAFRSVFPRSPSYFFSFAFPRDVRFGFSELSAAWVYLITTARPIYSTVVTFSLFWISFTACFYFLPGLMWHFSQFVARRITQDVTSHWEKIRRYSYSSTFSILSFKRSCKLEQGNND